MDRSKVGPIIILAIVAGVALIFLANRETEPSSPGKTSTTTVLKPPSQAVPPDEPKSGVAAKVREYPIGDEVTKHNIQIAAVWLPSVGMQGIPDPSDDVIHVEADIRATSDNANGFAKDEFVPYLKVRYELFDAKTGKPEGSGELTPMVASDGLHYGANIAKPAVGAHRLVYKIEPPSAGGLGRHSDKATGVAPWWEPFEATFDWTMDATTTSTR